MDDFVVIAPYTELDSEDTKESKAKNPEQLSEMISVIKK